MELDDLMATTQRLNLAVETLAAIGARTRAGLADLHLDPAIAAHLDHVVSAAGLDPAAVDRLPPEARQAALGAIQAFFAQAADLLAHPEHPPGWRYEDPAVIESQGRASAAIAGLVAGFAARLGDLGDRLAAPGTTFLDVGAGVGWLSIAMARTFPELTVIGLDIWAVALERARHNVAEAGLDDRIEVREQDVTLLDDLEAFDLVFLPGPFLPAEVVPVALHRSAAALRPGGWTLLGLYAGPPDPQAQALIDLRVIRSGGHPWRIDEAAEALTKAGYTDVHPVERTWQLPMTFVAGRAP